MSVLVFDIETVPCAEMGKKKFGLQGLEKDIIQAMPHAWMNIRGSTDFLPHYMHKIVAISVLWQNQQDIRIWTLGEHDDPESSIIERFYEGIAKYKPQLVSWNGNRFDLPVIHYRTLKHGINAQLYWEQGENIQAFKWNNYINRYHDRHLDLMDTMAGFNQQAWAPLDDIAQMLDLPGKMLLSGHNVTDAYLNGEIETIRHYCEIDVLNTYLVYLHFQLMRNHLQEDGFAYTIETVKQHLSDHESEHLQMYLKAWE